LPWPVVDERFHRSSLLRLGEARRMEMPGHVGRLLPSKRRPKPEEVRDQARVTRKVRSERSDRAPIVLPERAGLTRAGLGAAAGRVELAEVRFPAYRDSSQSPQTRSSSTSTATEPVASASGGGSAESPTCSARKGAR
jgi:hypothetical protein